MIEKSYVSLERRICSVCGAEYDTGALLIDKRLRPSMDKHTTTGWGLCSTHEQLFRDGFVALIECDPTKSGNPAAGSRVKPDQAYRTGRIAHLQRDAFAEVFNVPIPPSLPCVFVEPGVLEKLQAMVQPSTSRSDDT